MNNPLFKSNKHRMERQIEYSKWRWNTDYNGYRNRTLTRHRLKTKIEQKRTKWILSITPEELLEEMGWYNE